MSPILFLGFMSSYVKLLWRWSVVPFHGHGALLLLMVSLPSTLGVCPHCFGNFAACTWDTNKICPTVAVVAENAKIITGGAVGALALASIIKAKFLRMFSKTSLSGLLTLINRPEPGAPFSITASTKGSAILSAISYGQITLEAALFQLSDLLEAASDADERTLFKGRIESLKILKPRTDADNSLPDAISYGVFSFLWAKVSEYVMILSRSDRTHLDLREVGSAGSSGGSFAARLVRPVRMEDFSEMINLFIMICHGLAVASCLVLTEFFAVVVFEGIRLRGESWQLTHEMMLIMFKRVEDSAGRITICTVFDDMYLNSIVLEATRNVEAFFRTRAGNAQKTITGQVAFNGKWTTGAKPCPHFNSEDRTTTGKSAPHPLSSLKPDGTCKFDHVCNKWVSDKGKRGQCLCTGGTPGHARFSCDNPKRCQEPVQ